MLTEEVAYYTEQLGDTNVQCENVLDSIEDGKQEETSVLTVNDKEFHIYLEGHKDHPDVKCPAHKEHTYLKEFVCPHCGTTFIAPCFNIASVSENDLKTLNSYETRYDLEAFQVEWYQVITCSHCYFSAFVDVFKNQDAVLYKTQYEDDLKRAFSSLFLNFTSTRTMDFVFAQYYLALICAKGLQDVQQIKARLWLNLSRLYEDVGDMELSYEAIRHAAETFKNNHIKSILKTKLEHRICVNIAGRLVAAGELKTAKELALLLTTNRDERTFYTSVAEDIILDMRSKNK
jgi:uncharacterized protein (DUF2225 family)